MRLVSGPSKWDSDNEDSQVWEYPDGDITFDRRIFACLALTKSTSKVRGRIGHHLLHDQSNRDCIRCVVAVRQEA